MPWVDRDVADDINQAAGRRWQALDLLPSRPGRPYALAPRPPVPQITLVPAISPGINQPLRPQPAERMRRERGMIVTGSAGILSNT